MNFGTDEYTLDPHMRAKLVQDWGGWVGASNVENLIKNGGAVFGSFSEFSFSFSFSFTPFPLPFLSSFSSPFLSFPSLPFPILLSLSIASIPHPFSSSPPRRPFPSLSFIVPSVPFPSLSFPSSSFPSPFPISVSDGCIHMLPVLRRPGSLLTFSSLFVCLFVC